MSMWNILWVVVAAIVALWLIGVVTRVVGSAVNLLLLAALFVAVYNMINGRRAA